MKISIFFISIFISLPLQASFETDIPLETSLGHIQTSLEDAGGKPIHLVIGGVPSEDHLKTQDFVRIYLDNNYLKALSKWDNSIMHAVLNCLKSSGQLLIPEALSACDAPRDADVTYLMKDYPLPSMILPQPFSPKTQLPWSPKQEGFFIEYPLWGVCMTTCFDGYWQYCPSRFYDDFLKSDFYTPLVDNISLTQGYGGYPNIGLEKRAQDWPEVFGPFLEKFSFFAVVKK